MEYQLWKPFIQLLAILCTKNCWSSKNWNKMKITFDAKLRYSTTAISLPDGHTIGENILSFWNASQISKIFIYANLTGFMAPFKPLTGINSNSFIIIKTKRWVWMMTVIPANLHKSIGRMSEKGSFQLKHSRTLCNRTTAYKEFYNTNS